VPLLVATAPVAKIETLVRFGPEIQELLIARAGLATVVAAARARAAAIKEMERMFVFI